MRGVPSLHVEYADPRRKYVILFIFSLFCEYINLEHVRIPVIHRSSQDQVEYVIHIRVAASQENVNMYSTHRVLSCAEAFTAGRCVSVVG